MKKTVLVAIWVLGLSSAFANQTDSLENALKTAEGDKKVKVMNELFRAYINSDPVKAIAYTREALTLATSINDQKGMAASYNNLGVAYRNQGALDVSLEYYLKSLQINTTLQNGEGIATTKNNIANIYSMKKDYAQALKYLEESHAGFVALGNPERIIGSMNNLGNLHSSLQLYEQALKYYHEAWKLSETTGHPLADPLINIGNVFFQQGNNQRAIEYYQRAMELVKKQNNRLSEVSLLTNIGTVYLKAGQPKESKRYLDEAMALATELGATLDMPQILKSLAGTYAQQGNMRDAYLTMLEFTEQQERIYGEESSRKIAQMDVAMELKEKEKEIEHLYMDGQVTSLRLRNTQIIVTAAVLGIIAVVAIANLFLMGKSKKRLK